MAHNQKWFGEGVCTRLFSESHYFPTEAPVGRALHTDPTRAGLWP